MYRLLAIVLISFFSYGTVKAQEEDGSGLGFFWSILTSSAFSGPAYHPTSEFTIEDLSSAPPFLSSWDYHYTFDDIEKTISIGLEDKGIIVSKASSNSLSVSMESKIGERSGDNMPKCYGYPTSVFYIYGEEELVAEVDIKTSLNKQIVEEMKKMDIGRFHYVTKSQLQQLLKKIEKDCVDAGYKLREYDEKLRIYIFDNQLVINECKRIMILVGDSGDVSIQFYYSTIDEDDDDEEDND